MEHQRATSSCVRGSITSLSVIATWHVWTGRMTVVPVSGYRKRVITLWHHGDGVEHKIEQLSKISSKRCEVMTHHLILIHVLKGRQVSSNIHFHLQKQNRTQSELTQREEEDESERSQQHVQYHAITKRPCKDNSRKHFTLSRSRIHSTRKFSQM